MDWYFTIGTERKGPVNLPEIKRLLSRGTLTQSDFVWNITMGEAWKQISEVPALSSRAITTSHKKNSSSVIDGKPGQAVFERRSKVMKIFILIAIIAAAAIIYRSMTG